MLALLNVRFGDLRCGAAVGLPQLQKDAASAITACAQVRFVPQSRPFAKTGPKAAYLNRAENEPGPQAPILLMRIPSLRALSTMFSVMPEPGVAIRP